MNPSMQPAIQHLFQVSTIEAVSREQLEKFVEEYPCFGFGHYLLSRKLRAENADQFLTATQKTNLYFSNPFWLQWMLENASEPAGKRKPAPAPVLEAHTPTPDPIVEENTPTPPPVVEEYIPTPPPVAEEQFPAPDQTPDLQLQEQTPEPISVDSHEEPIYDLEPPFVLDEQEHSAEPAPLAAAELLLESIETARSLRESLQKMNEVYQSHNGRPEEPLRDEPPPIVPEEPLRVEPPPFIPEEPGQPVSTPETTPLFEPLHTIDYFASQGIRLTLDENPTDPLGRQLKSFTDWLRTMRRLPQKDREIIPDRVAEQAIQSFAAHSIEGKEPVTETMAEVLAKQGMPERARVVYEKLSLLNPDKSAYFAAKIEQLNNH